MNLGLTLNYYIYFIFNTITITISIFIDIAALVGKYGCHAAAGDGSAAYLEID